VAEVPPPSAPNRGLVRAIGRWSLALLTVNFIIGSGIFGMPSVVAGLLGRASLLAVPLAGAAIAIVISCFAEVASQFTETGGPYFYVRAAFGRLMGIQVGWLVWLVRLTASAANVNLFTTYLGEFWPRATQPAPRFLILTLLIGILAAVNYCGVQAGMRVSNALTVAKLLPLGLVCVAGVFYLIPAHPVVHPAGVSPDANAWMRAMLLLVFAYGGFEGALVPAGEAKDPRRDTVFALFTALLTCTVIYSLIQWVVVGTLPDPAHSERPLADVARIILGNGGAALIAVGALISAYGTLCANIIATPRITFALAERGDFPSRFASVHPKFRTPHFSILVFALLVWLFALFGSFAGNATLSATARLSYYGLVCATLPVLRRKQPGAASFRLPGGSLFAVLGVLICFGLLARVDFSKSLVLIATVVAGLLNWLVVRRTRGVGQ
jgi:basic amino acid/polyamine antiporter, APA family